MDYAAFSTYGNTAYADNSNYAYRDMTSSLSASANSASPVTEEETVILQNKFGAFRFEPETFITFQQGLIGLTEYTRFALATIPNGGEKNNFRLLQSLEEGSLSFVVLPTTAANSLLEAQDVDSICSNFGIAKDDLVLMHIVTMRSMFGKVQMTLNVKAPIVVDASKRTATQYVMPSNKYDIQAPLAA